MGRPLTGDGGKAEASFINEDGTQVDSSFQVADVCRPLHSVSKVCDTDKEVLFTKHGGVVVPAGSLSKFLGSVQALAKTLGKVASMSRR